MKGKNVSSSIPSQEGFGFSGPKGCCWPPDDKVHECPNYRDTQVLSFPNGIPYGLIMTMAIFVVIREIAERDLEEIILKKRRF